MATITGEASCGSSPSASSQPAGFLASTSRTVAAPTWATRLRPSISLTVRICSSPTWTGTCMTPAATAAIAAFAALARPVRRNDKSYRAPPVCCRALPSSDHIGCGRASPQEAQDQVVGVVRQASLHLGHTGKSRRHG